MMMNNIINQQKINKRQNNFHQLSLQASVNNRQKVKNRAQAKSYSSTKQTSQAVKARSGKSSHNISLKGLKENFQGSVALVFGAAVIFVVIILLLSIDFSSFKGSANIQLKNISVVSEEMKSFVAPDYSGMGGSAFTDEPPKLKELNPVNYVIKQGDTIYELAKNFGIKPQTIVSYNNISNTQRLQVGDRLIVPAIDGIPYTVKSGDSISLIADKHKIPVNDLLDANNLESDILTPGDSIFIPGVIDNYKYKLAIGKLIKWPTSGKITSRFGYRKDPFSKARRFHYGLDIANRLGTKIISAIDGRVIEVSKNSVYGNYVVIEDAYGLQTYYAHLRKATVKKRQYVKQGQKIGEMGSTGLSTGSHLHFAVYKNGRAKNPLEYLDE